MSLRERVTGIFNEFAASGVFAIDYYSMEPPYDNPSCHVQRILEAVCAERGHDWPREITAEIDTKLGVPLIQVAGPCRICGKEKL